MCYADHSLVGITLEEGVGKRGIDIDILVLSRLFLLSFFPSLFPSDYPFLARVF
jgi:hypothetical protein